MEGDGVTKRREFGGSLPVPNVQQLASSTLQQLNQIPHRYIRPEHELDLELDVNDSPAIPVIDMANLLSESNQTLEYDLEMASLHQACKNWGFFQLINHGVGEVMEEMKGVVQEFFKLPLEEKMKCGQMPDGIEGYGQAFVVSEDQKLDWGDMHFIMTLPVSLRNNNFWPDSPPNYRATLHNYSEELHKIAVKLLARMATNLGIESHVLTSAYEDGNQGIRMNYYPPCIQADKVIGIAPHSDATGLTLLVQVSEVHGLQIRKDGQWLPIRPIPGAIIVNIGDILEIMSNGEYKSIEHRATVNTEKERLSMAAFHSPNTTCEIGPLQEPVNISDDKYKTLTHEEYLKLAVASKLDGKSLLGRMKIVR